MWTDEQIALAREKLREINGTEVTHEKMKRVIKEALNPRPVINWTMEAVAAFEDAWHKTYRTRPSQVRAALTEAVRAQGLSVKDEAPKKSGGE